MDFFGGLLYASVNIIDPREIRTGHLAKTMVETVKFLLFETPNSLKFSNSDDTCDRVLQRSRSCDSRHMRRGTAVAVQHADPLGKPVSFGIPRSLHAPCGLGNCFNLLDGSAVFLCDNGRPHIAQQSLKSLKNCRQQTVVLPTYSQNSAPAHCHLFPTLKHYLSVLRFICGRDIIGTTVKPAYKGPPIYRKPGQTENKFRNGVISHVK